MVSFCASPLLLLYEANSQSKAVAVRKHLERNRKDKDSKFRLILIESRIHRLARYYKTVGVLPPTWKYESSTASTIVA
jgi:small subunit ribosomal protein S13e